MRRARVTFGAAWGLLAVTASVGCASHNAAASRASLAATGSIASPSALSVSEQTFACILDWPQVRNTRIKHADPQQLAEAMRIFRDSVPNVEYPVGTILQLVPFEAMVKHPREKFPKTNGWEFFA